jgi:N-acetylneuraminic acid mutarotase
VENETMLNRRGLLVTGAAAIAAPALAQAPAHNHGAPAATAAPHANHAPPFERLAQPGRVPLPDLHHEQKVLDGPAPKAQRQGRWMERAQLPLPRTEMAWAVEVNGRMHVVGGYAEQRVDRAYHHIYDPVANTWATAAEIPRGANHVGVASFRNQLYAFGGFLDQNRRPHDEVFRFDAAGNRWVRLRPLPRACGAMACVGLGDKIHLIGGAMGDTNETRKSIDWHVVYDPATDTYATAQPLHLGRDHTGIVVFNNLIHLIGGRVDTFHTNSALHHTYNAQTDAWTLRNPMPTQRSGHGLVVYRNKIHAMGGEGTNRVFGVHEAFDPATDRWEQFAPMTTPRHGMGAVVLGDAIYVAGGGPIVGGGVKSAIHEAFTLA